MNGIKKVLVKLPVKLGDTIMATSFLKALKFMCPESQVDVILATGLSDLIQFIPYVNKYYEFSKIKYNGPLGNFRFGRMIASQEKYDLFFCLPFSFSAALQGYFTGSKIRIGHNTEHRGFLFTNKYKLPPDLHVLEDYINLLEQFFGKEVKALTPSFTFPDKVNFEIGSKEYLVLNAVSGPPSRFIPVIKARQLLIDLSNEYDFDIVLTGAPNEVNYIGEIVAELPSTVRVINCAGKTSITELGWILKNAKGMISTDSGNAHYANALGTRSVILFGAAPINRSYPYNRKIVWPLQLTNLDCVPCRSEQCKYGDNRCLANIGNKIILAAVKELLKQKD